MQCGGHAAKAGIMPGSGRCPWGSDHER